MRSVREALSDDGFKAADFDLAQTVEPEFVVLSIKYRFAEGYYLLAKYRTRAAAVKSFHDPTSTDEVGVVRLRMLPGQVLREENRRIIGDDALLDAIRDWVPLVREELLAIPINRRVEETRMMVEDLIAQFEADADSYFTVDEADELDVRITALEGRLTSVLDSTIADRTEYKRRLEELQLDINTLRQQVETLTRGNWAKSFAVRVAEWMRDPMNRKLLHAGSEVIRSVMLPPGEKP